MELVRRWLNRLDSLFEYFGLSLLSAMILIVTWQVFSRYVRNTTPYWSEEVTLILMVWVALIGIAIGFRERLHIAIEVVVRRFPESVQRWIQRTINVLILLFGLYFLVQGWQFTRIAHLSTLPATSLPSSVMYVIMPISGVMIVAYAVLQLLGVRTEKHRDLTEGEEQSPETTVARAEEVD